MSAIRATTALLASALVATGCGLGGGDDEASAPTEDPSVVLEEAFTSTDPAICERLFTEKALAQRQVTGGDTPPLEDCQTDMAEDPDAASAIEVQDLAVTDTTATATVVPKGSDINGAAMELELVNEDGWRIDRIGELQILDPETFYDSFTADLTDVDALSAAHKRCISAYVSTEVPQRTVERTFSTGDAEYVFDSLRECVGGGSDERTIAEILRGQLISEQGLSAGQAACVVESVSDVFAGAKLSADLDLDTPELRAAAERAGAKCVGAEGPQGTPSPDSPGGAPGDDAYLDCVAATPVDRIEKCEDKA